VIGSVVSDPEGGPKTLPMPGMDVRNLGDFRSDLQCAGRQRESPTARSAAGANEL